MDRQRPHMRRRVTLISLLKSSVQRDESQKPLFRRETRLLPTLLHLLKRPFCFTFSFCFSLQHAGRETHILKEATAQ